MVDYDAAGNIAWTASGLDLTDAGACNRTEASASGRRVDRAYDALNRVVRIRFPDRNGDQDLSYRNSGEVQSVTTWNDQGKQTTVNSFQYNKRNLLVGESAASTGRPTWSMGYGYDTQGALASMVYPGGLTVSYANNAQGQPLSVSVGGVSYASGVRYHPTGAVQSFSYGNGIVHATQLNARQLPYQQTDAGAMSYRYSYDAIGNVTGIADLQQGAGFDRTLQYDAGQRLIAAGSASFGGDHWHRYSYDARDNLLSASLGGVKDYRYWYDERNRLANILNADGATIIGLSYDAQGNLRSKNGRVHEFDLGNRLRTIQGLESYQYDAAGRRTVTSDGSGDRLRSFYGQGGQLLYEQRRDGGAAEFIMLGSRLLAKRQGGVVTYQHVDSLGSPVATSNAAGQVTERTQYEPYGQSIGKSVDGVGYTGHVSDAASGLVYMQQRYYDPQIGRFLSVDPLTAYSSPVGAFNRYRYADNSPYNFTDPDGRQSRDHYNVIDEKILTGIYVKETPVTMSRSERLTAGVFGGADLVYGSIGASGYAMGALVGISSPMDGPVLDVAFAVGGLKDGVQVVDGLRGVLSALDGRERPSSLEQAGGFFGGEDGAKAGKAVGTVVTFHGAAKALSNIDGTVKGFTEAVKPLVEKFSDPFKDSQEKTK